MNKLSLIRIVFWLSIIFGIAGIFFSAQPIEMWGKTEYKRDYFVEPIGIVHDETKPTVVTVQNNEPNLGLSLCILASAFFISFVLLVKDRSSKSLEKDGITDSKA